MCSLIPELEIRFSELKSTYVTSITAPTGLRLQVIIMAKGKHISIANIWDFVFRGAHVLRHTKEQG